MAGEEDAAKTAQAVEKEEAEARVIAIRVPFANLVIMVEAVHLIVKNAHEADTNPMKHPVVARAVPMGGTKIKYNKDTARNQATEDIVIIQNTKIGAKGENTQMHNKKVANHAQVDGKE